MNGDHHQPVINGPNILQALDLVYSRASDNDTRRHASEFLDTQKDAEGAYQHGFVLASDTAQTSTTRHYGLSLLEHTIRQRWHDLPEADCEQVRGLILKLVHGLRHEDPPYLRRKIASLWVELAKKSWALDWFDMDAILLDIWNANSYIPTEFVLTVLENLSEDTFVRDDPAASLRGHELNSALVEIFTSASLFTGGVKAGKTLIQLRADDKGWLARLVEFVKSCVSNDLSAAPERAGLKMALDTIRSVILWIMPGAIVSTHCLQWVCGALKPHDPETLMVRIHLVGILICAYSCTGCRAGATNPLCSLSFQRWRVSRSRMSNVSTREHRDSTNAVPVVGGRCTQYRFTQVPNLQKVSRGKLRIEGTGSPLC